MNITRALPTFIKRAAVKGRINKLNNGCHFSPPLMAPNHWTPDSAHSRFTEAIIAGNKKAATDILEGAEITISPRKLQKAFRAYWA